MAVMVVATTPQVAAQDDADRFRLFNNCEPMDLFVEKLPSNAADIGLTEEHLQFAAESRLRAARLYVSTPAPYLYVRVRVLDSAFSLNVRYVKRVLDFASGEGDVATTWESGGLGTHDGHPEYIVSQLSRYLDQFLTEYLRVNEDACER